MNILFESETRCNQFNKDKSMVWGLNSGNSTYTILINCTPNESCFTIHMLYHNN